MTNPIDYEDNYEQFQKEWRKFRKTIDDESLIIRNKIILTALARIVHRTPVDTGRARGSWQVSIGEPLETVPDRLDEAGQQEISKAIQILETMPMDSSFFISSNLSYILPLENGSSKQAPEGMVALTLQELKSKFKQWVV